MEKYPNASHRKLRSSVKVVGLAVSCMPTQLAGHRSVLNILSE